MMRALIAFAVCLLIGCADSQRAGLSIPRGVTYSQWQAASLGMTYDQVCGVFRSEGTEIDINEFLPSDYPMTFAGNEVYYQWKGNGIRGANVTAMFQDDRLQALGYAGLAVPGRRDKSPSNGLRSTIINYER